MKTPQLVEALRGRVRAIHRFRLQQQLQRIDFIDEQIAQLEAEIEKQNAPLKEAVLLLAEIPGFDRTTAWSVIAEIGVDMNQFPSADNLASWAGVCPGNNESAGKRLSARNVKGADGYSRSFARAPGGPLEPKTATSPPTFNVSLPTESRSELSSPSAIPCPWSVITCFSADVIFKTLGVDYLNRLNHEKLTRILANG